MGHITNLHSFLINLLEMSVQMLQRTPGLQPIKTACVKEQCAPALTWARFILLDDRKLPLHVQPLSLNLQFVKDEIFSGINYLALMEPPGTGILLTLFPQSEVPLYFVLILTIITGAVCFALLFMSHGVSRSSGSLSHSNS